MSGSELATVAAAKAVRSLQAELKGVAWQEPERRAAEAQAVCLVWSLGPRLLTARVDHEGLRAVIASEAGVRRHLGVGAVTPAQQLVAGYRWLVGALDPTPRGRRGEADLTTLVIGLLLALAGVLLLVCLSGCAVSSSLLPRRPQDLALAGVSDRAARGGAGEATGAPPQAPGAGEATGAPPRAPGVGGSVGAPMPVPGAGDAGEVEAAARVAVGIARAEAAAARARLAEAEQRLDDAQRDRQREREAALAGWAWGVGAAGLAVAIGAVVLALAVPVVAGVAWTVALGALAVAAGSSAFGAVLPWLPVLGAVLLVLGILGLLVFVVVRLWSGLLRLVRGVEDGKAAVAAEAAEAARAPAAASEAEAVDWGRQAREVLKLALHRALDEGDRRLVTHAKRRLGVGS